MQLVIKRGTFRSAVLFSAGNRLSSLVTYRHMNYLWYMLKKTICFSFLLLAAVGCNSGTEAAGIFNDRVVNLSNGCVLRQESLLKTTEKQDETAARKALAELRSYTVLATDSLNLLKTPDEQEGVAFYKAAAAYMDNLVKTCDNEYIIYIRMHCRPDSLFTENDQLFIDSLAQLINSRDSIADFEFNRAQKIFAQKYNIDLK